MFIQRVCGIRYATIHWPKNKYDIAVLKELIIKKTAWSIHSAIEISEKSVQVSIYVLRSFKDYYM